jgi:anti-sigma B factor antagonist
MTREESFTKHLGITDMKDVAVIDAGIVAGVDLDVYSGPRFKQAILNALEEGKPYILADLSGCKTIDSTGLGLLIGGAKRSGYNGCYFGVVCTAPDILMAFEMTGLDRIFDIYSNVSEVQS